MAELLEALIKMPQVRIKNPDYMRSVFEEFIDGNSQKLQVISDFDQTLTKDHEDGERCLTTFGIFHSTPQLPDGYCAQSEVLYHKYHPMEVHPDLSVEEKTPYMVQWYKDSEQLLFGADVSKENLKNHIYSSKTIFRDGSKDIFDALKKAGVPVLVFSAGVGDVVRHALEKHQMLLDNVRIISNFLNWDSESGKLAGFQGDMIHVFNKNQRAVAAHEEYFSLLANRPNVILMGDNEGDAAMGHGVQNPKAMIKIGFLYHHANERLEKFMDMFDIVLIDDQTMDVPKYILNYVIGKENFN
ncbi:7-methylguanosine phosphate-specific 5'-nucleotidase-like isoform X2 [Cloeon dipterum]|uniref:7-methylguanosine phosphate-specific 5'-nucleotidase-like isoform X2 n=1 Tax=Cloeon dipterum TaxID=197152 RepID=UPI00322092D0